MCMLTYFPPGVKPDLNALDNGALFNDDGHGFAIVAPGRLIVRHGMDSELLITLFGECRAEHPDGPALFHSRFATHGKRGRENCHPFRVGHDDKTVLAHNGILPRRVRPKNGDRRSDTRIAAEEFLPGKSYNSWDDYRKQRDLARWLGPGNKLVILTVDPQYSEHSYVINEEAGIWDGGIWYSNTDYQGYASAGIGFGTGLDTSSCRDCPVCLAPGVVNRIGYCLLCGGCADCGEPDGCCACYSPGRFPFPANANWYESPDTVEVATVSTLNDTP